MLNVMSPCALVIFFCFLICLSTGSFIECGHTNGGATGCVPAFASCYTIVNEKTQGQVSGCKLNDDLPDWCINGAAGDIKCGDGQVEGWTGRICCCSSHMCNDSSDFKSMLNAGQGWPGWAVALAIILPVLFVLLGAGALAYWYLKVRERPEEEPPAGYALHNIPEWYYTYRSNPLNYFRPPYVDV